MFPGRLKTACVHAGPRARFFLPGKFSLKNSLRREFQNTKFVQRFGRRFLTLADVSLRAKSGDSTANASA
jgi:hypothetical protein